MPLRSTNRLDWDTSQVTDMTDMFYCATSFNQPLTFNTSQVTDMSDMFMGATAMTYPVPQDEAVSSEATSSDSDDDVDEDDEDEAGKEGEAVQCTDKSQELCVVCVFSCVDTVLVPCGHACMCRRCAKRVQGTSVKCPICRVPIECILFNKIYHTGIKQDA